MRTKSITFEKFKRISPLKNKQTNKPFKVFYKEIVAIQQLLQIWLQCYSHLRNLEKKYTDMFPSPKSFDLIVLFGPHLLWSHKKAEWYFPHSGRMRDAHSRISETPRDYSNPFLLNSQIVFLALGKTKSVFQKQKGK